MMASRSHFHGVQEAKSAFRELARFAQPAMNAAARESLKPTLAKAKEYAAEAKDSGLFIKSLGIIRSKESRNLRSVYYVAPRPGKRHATLGHLIEWGAVRAKHGVMRGVRFMTRAWAETSSAADMEKRLAANLKPAFEKRAKQLATRAAKRKR